MRLDDLALEIFVEKIGRAHGPEAQRVVHARLAQAVEALPEIQQLLDVARLERRRVRRLAHQQRLDELALAHHVARDSGRRPPRRAWSGARSRGAARRGCRRVARWPPLCIMRAAALVGNHLQAVARQLQRAHDLRPQQAAHVGAVRVGEVLVKRAADGRAADVGDCARAPAPSGPRAPGSRPSPGRCARRRRRSHRIASPRVHLPGPGGAPLPHRGSARCHRPDPPIWRFFQYCTIVQRAS